MNKSILLPAILLAGAAMMQSCNTSAQENKTGMDDKRSMDDKSMDNKMSSDNNKIMPDLKSWPEASRMAAQEMMDKYGNPDAMGAEVLVWMNKGQWKSIYVTKQETKHSFPIEHTDMLKQTISYKVSPDKYDELGKFDGSVIIDRTQGLLSARCDKEANNMLALNLANDIITGKKSVDEARKAFGEIVKEKMNGGNPEYMQKLTFPIQGSAGDPDMNTTGLSKEDAMKGSKENMQGMKTEEMKKGK
ncbi:MAG: hypothetical protein SH857_06260 [Chitinophagales bacterium]|nr:hypothetical protein [Chitinophagales bacterium]